MQFSSDNESLPTCFTNEIFPEAPTIFRTKDSVGNNVLEWISSRKDGNIKNKLVNYNREKMLDINFILFSHDNINSLSFKKKKINLSKSKNSFWIYFFE
jgi:hypothetical protein